MLGKRQQRLRRRDKLCIEIVRAGLLRRALALGNVALADHFVCGKVVTLGKLGRVRMEAEGIELFGKHGRDVLVAVNDKYMRRLRVEGLDPLDEVVMVGVGGKTLEVDDLCLDGDLLTEKLDLLHAVEQSAAQRAGRLEADEHDRAVRAPEVVLQMVADAAGVAHTGGGNDDLGRRVHVQHLRFLARLNKVEVGEGEHVRAVLDKIERLLVEIAVQIAAEDGRCRPGKGRVDVHREVRRRLDELLVLDLADKVQKLLRAPDGERRDHNVAALAERFVDDLGKLVGIAPHLGVVAVAVGRLHHDVIRLLEELRVADDGLVDIADVTGEDERLVHAVFLQFERDGCRAEQMPRIGKDRAYPLAEVDLFFILAGRDVLEDVQRVLLGVERLNGLAARALALAVFVFRVALLNVGRVEQHDLHQISRHARCEDPAVKAVFHQQRDAAGVVDVRVGDEQNVDAAGGKGEITVVELIAPLLQAAVNEDLLAVDLQTVAGACHAAVSSVKVQFHALVLLRSLDQMKKLFLTFCPPPLGDVSFSYTILYHILPQQQCRVQAMHSASAEFIYSPFILYSKFPFAYRAEGCYTCRRVIMLPRKEVLLYGFFQQNVRLLQ